VTGHRPPRLGGYTSEVERRLAALADETLAELRPARVISGMAQGWDLAVAEACVRGDVPFVAALAFPDAASSWPEAERARLDRALAEAERVETLAEAPDRGVFHARDRWIVAHADTIVALWDGERSGGAFATVRSAEKRRVPVINLWSRWLAL